MVRPLIARTSVWHTKQTAQVQQVQAFQVPIISTLIVTVGVTGVTATAPLSEVVISQNNGCDKPMA